MDWKVTVLSYWDDSFSPKDPQSLAHVSQPTPRRIKKEGVGGERESSAIVQSSHFSLVCDSDDITIMHIYHYVLMAVLMCTHMLLPCVIGLTWSRWTCVVSPGRWISCYILVSLLHWCIDLYTHADRQQRAFEHISKSAHMRMVVGGLLSTITAQCGSLSSAHLSCYSNTTTLLWHHTLCNTQVPHHKMSDSHVF